MQRKSVDDFHLSLYNTGKLKEKVPHQGVITHHMRSRLESHGRHPCCHLHKSLLSLLWRYCPFGSRHVGGSIVMEASNFTSWNFGVLGPQWLGFIVVIILNFCWEGRILFLFIELFLWEIEQRTSLEPQENYHDKRATYLVGAAVLGPFLPLWCFERDGSSSAFPQHADQRNCRTSVATIYEGTWW